MKEHSLNLGPVGIKALRHPRAENGPRVWTILFRVGWRRRLW